MLCDCGGKEVGSRGGGSLGGCRPEKVGAAKAAGRGAGVLGGKIAETGGNFG